MVTARFGAGALTTTGPGQRRRSGNGKYFISENISVLKIFQAGNLVLDINLPYENRNKNVISKRKILCEAFITYILPPPHSPFFFQFEIRFYSFEGVTPLNIH